MLDCWPQKSSHGSSPQPGQQQSVLGIKQNGFGGRLFLAILSGYLTVWFLFTWAFYLNSAPASASRHAWRGFFSFFCRQLPGIWCGGSRMDQQTPSLLSAHPVGLPDDHRSMKCHWSMGVLSLSPSPREEENWDSLVLPGIKLCRLVLCISTWLNSPD